MAGRASVAFVATGAGKSALVVPQDSMLPH